MPAASARQSANPRSLVPPREDLGDRKEEKEESTKDIYPDHGAVCELGAQRRMAEQIPEPLRQSDQQDEKKHERPSPDERENGEDREDARDARVAPMDSEKSHAVRRSPFGAAGGNVWESNPPRTLETPDKRI